MKQIAIALTLAVTLLASSASADTYNYYNAAPTSAGVNCNPPGKKGAAKAGIIVGSILLPLSLIGVVGVGIGGARLRKHKKAEKHCPSYAKADVR